MSSFVVIGLGRFGSVVAETLAAKGAEVMAVDRDAGLVNAIKDKVLESRILDTTNENALEAIGVTNADAVIVAIGEDIESSILTTMSLKNLGVRHILARAANEQHAQILQKVGASKIFQPEKDIAYRAAMTVLSPSVLQYIELDPEHSLIEIEAREDFVGKSLQQLDFRKKYNLSVIALKRKKPDAKLPGQRYMKIVDAEDIIQPGDLLVAVGKNDAIQKFSS